MRTTLRFHFTPVRMAKINNARNSSSWGYSKGHIHQWWEWNLHRYYESLCDSFRWKMGKDLPKIEVCHSWAHSQRILHPIQEIFTQLCSLLLCSQEPETRNNLDSPKENMDKDCLVCFLPLAQVSSSSSLEGPHWPPVLPGWWFNCLPC